MATMNPHLQTKTMFGSQAHSKRRSAPSFGFGSSTRNQAAKVFLSQEHAKLSTPSFSPGPSAYTLRASVGSQADGRKASSPQWVFGSSDRFIQASRKEVQNPGPGSYDMPQGVGTQVSSSKQTQPMFGFGSAEREHVEKVFVSEDHNKSLFGIESPGPMMYTLQSAVGKQDLSRKANQPSWVFASSERFRYDHVKRAATSPGPGAYTLGQSVGPQVASTKHSAPLPGFGTSNREHMGKLYISSEHVRLPLPLACPRHSPPCTCWRVPSGGKMHAHALRSTSDSPSSRPFSWRLQEKSLSGNNSPGPCNYALPEATGPQPLSKYSSAPRYGFGSANRWQSDKSQKSGTSTPGPGTYCI